VSQRPPVAAGGAEPGGGRSSDRADTVRRGEVNAGRSAARPSDAGTSAGGPSSSSPSSGALSSGGSSGAGRPCFPQYAGKQGEPALVEPQAYIRYLNERGLGPGEPAPERAVLCYEPSLVEHLKAVYRLEAVPGVLGTYLYRLPEDPTLAVGGGFGIGAPVAVAILEELVALGCRHFVSVGTAGSLQPDLAVGELVVCERAVRDEGTSHHYLPAGEYAAASLSLTRHLEEALAAHGRSFVSGASWTIDAFYRETVTEARHYQSQGVLTVEMEAAALFAVAAYRGVQAAAVFTVSDSLAGLEWRPEFHQAGVQDSLEAMFAAARQALARSHDTAEDGAH
jgi:uridine phosphorylase